MGWYCREGAGGLPEHLAAMRTFNTLPSGAFKAKLKGQKTDTELFFCDIA